MPYTKTSSSNSDMNVLDFADFGERGFAPQHDAGKTESAVQLCRLAVYAVRLRAQVQRRVREAFAEQVEQAQVLYDECVERILPEQGDMFPEPRQIAVVKAYVERAVELSAGKRCFNAPRLKHGQVSKIEMRTSRPLKCPLQDS